MLFSNEFLSNIHLPDNRTELLPGLLLLVPNMTVLLTDNIACELGLSNGTQGIFRELIYDDQEDLGDLKIKSDVFPSNTIYIRKPLYACVEINTSQVETTVESLPPKVIPIPLVPLGTTQVASVYVPLSRVKRAEDVAILRPFDMQMLQIQPSLAQDTELKRIDELNRKTQQECASLVF